jgi:D-amino-acid dehydrogenase
VIQRESIARYFFPRNLKKIIKYATNQLPEAHLHWRSLPWLAPTLYHFWRRSTPDRVAQSVRAMWAITDGCMAEHLSLMEKAGALGLLRRTGYLKFYRHAAAFEQGLAIEKAAYERFGASFLQLDTRGVRELEPRLNGEFAGAIFLPNHISVSDPGALGGAYATLFQNGGGRILRGDALSLNSTDDGWQVATMEAQVEAPEAVVAMGPWSGDALARLGIRVPLGVKRGYHIHLQPLGNAGLSRPVVDAEYGYVLSQMQQGIRLTTGAEFALRDSPSTPVQLAHVEPVARRLFPLGPRVEQTPWRGARPFLPDLLPMIGKVPGRKGLWTNFGHHHLGFSTGPTTGRLLAEMMVGADTFADPAPYRVDRFSAP